MSDTGLILVNPGLWDRIREQLEYTAASFHQSQEQTYSHDGTRGVTFRECPDETCRENAQLLADLEGDD
jgi:hypothetical protein